MNRPVTTSQQLSKTTSISTTKRTMKSLASSLRPRERLLKYGAEYIELYELIAIIIRSGTMGHNALKIAQRVQKVLESQYYKIPSIEQLKKIPGISTTKAIEICASYELGKRIYELGMKNAISIQEVGDVLPYLNDIKNTKKEHFMALYLDTKNTLIHKEVISVGILDASLVHPREVFEPAYRSHCSRVILAHNHPSGNTEPSSEDIKSTKELVEAGRVLGIQVLDHIVVSSMGYCSLRQIYPELFELNEHSI